MAIGDEEPTIIDIVDWAELYARNDGDEAIIPGLAFRGRWTAIAAAAKEGKSTVLLGLVIKVAQAGMKVLYLDAEMGRGDILDRVEDWMQLKPDDLVNLHYSDLPPKLDTVEGAAMLGRTVEAIEPDLVVIDGLNGVINGAEKDDTPWRDMFEWAIRPLKTLNVAVVSADNLGKDKTQGPRGSSVKLDKADAIIALERTENGVKLKATHRRSASYPAEQHYVVKDAGDEGPPMSVRPADGDYVAGSKELAAELDRLDAPMHVKRREARRLLKEAGVTAANNILGSALRYRRETLVRISADQLRGTPASTADQIRVCSEATPGPVGSDADSEPTDDPYGVF